MTDNALSKDRRRSIWVPLVIMMTLAICATAGYSYWRMQQRQASAQVKAPKPPPAPVFFALDTFTVNLSDADADRVLYIGITLRLKDEATRQRLSEFLPEVRSRLLLLFSRQDSVALASDEGKQKLVEEIKHTLAPPLVAGQPQQVISDVLYTIFILR